MTSNPSAGRWPILRFLEKIEDSILILLLLLMICMAVLQIVLRNFMDSGILWADPLIRVLVLWIGLVGAMIASRNNQHISVDILSRYLPEQMKMLSTAVICCFTAVICGLMTYFSAGFVLMEKQDGFIAFGTVPAWVCESIMPVAFAVITLRYAVLSVSALKSVFHRQTP